jgi:hypothetical protein
MRYVILVLIAAVVGGCTHGAAPSAPRTTHETSTSGRRFASAQAAVRRTCGARWVGVFIKGTHETQIQWQAHYAPNDGGVVADLLIFEHSYRVTNCHAGRYGVSPATTPNTGS